MRLSSFFLPLFLAVAIGSGAASQPARSQVLADPDHLPEDVLDELPPATAVCTIVSPDQEPPVVVIGARATASEKYAAQELAWHLEKITGRKIAIIGEEAAPPEGAKVIAVGESRWTKEEDVAGLGVEQYLINVQPSRVAIVGGRKAAITAPNGSIHVRDRGTLYGVYAFLEGLGVRWYRPEPWGWHIPSTTTVEVKLGKTVSPVPAFIGRQAVSTTCRWDGQTPAELEESVVWSVRQRTNVKTSKEAKYGGTVEAGMDHAHSRIIPPAKYLEKHPEYFALVNGKRGNPGTGRTPQLCLGNPELQEIFAQNVIKQAKEKPQAISISVDPDDGTQRERRMCACTLCLAMDDPANPELMSNRVFGFTNIVARKVAKEVPEAKLGLYAYSMHTEPPTLFEGLEPNIILAIANINSWSDWSKQLTDPESWQNNRFLNLANEWKKRVANPFWMREYSAYGWAGPVPMYRLLKERIATYRDLGVEGFDYSNRPNRGPQMLYLYLKAQLQWNPDLDVDHELDLFYTNYYGPAAKPMKAYHERSMEAFEAFGVGTGPARTTINSGARGMHLFYTPALVEALGKDLEEAKELAKGHPLYQRRLEGALAGHEFCRRVSEIMTLKLQDGVPTPHPLSPNGEYLHSEKATQAWNELLKWAVDQHQGDLIFAIETKQGKLVNPEFAYMRGDLLMNRKYAGKNERSLLIDHGFDAASSRSTDAQKIKASISEPPGEALPQH